MKHHHNTLALGFILLSHGHFLAHVPPAPEEALTTASRGSSFGRAIDFDQWRSNYAPNTTEQEAFNKALEQNLVVVDFYASWCGPCQRYAPEFEKVAAKFPNILFLKINTEKFSALSGQFSVRSIPTTIFFKNGKVIQRASGGMTEQQLSVKVNQTFK